MPRTGSAEGSGTEVFGVEPAGCDGLTQSLAAGHPVTVSPAPTLADGLTPASPGRLAYTIARERIAGTAAVTDESLRRALVLALVHLKLVLEPSGAAGLAAALDGAFAGFGHVGIVLTGGNVGPALIARLIAEQAA